MRMNKTKHVLSLLLCLVLLAAMALSFTGCTDEITPTEEPKSEVFADGDVLGKGDISFSLTVVDADGKEITATVFTEKKIVGEALLELGIIDGENSDYGLYVKTVNGTTLDYDTDGKYWAFYIDGEYAMTGIDNTEIVEGTSYSLKAE